MVWVIQDDNIPWRKVMCVDTLHDRQWHRAQVNWYMGSLSEHSSLDVK